MRRTLSSSFRLALPGALAAAALVAGAVAAAQNRPCPPGRHDSVGQCCGAGEEWVPARTRCMCVDGVEACRVPPPPPEPVTPPPPPPPVVPSARCPEGMVLVAGGSFNLGADASQTVAEPSERPAHRVTLEPYCLDRNEVNVQRFQECVSSGACVMEGGVNLPSIPPAQLPAWNQLCNGAHADRGDHPMNCVSYAQAQSYCGFRRGRLPTEAEWEFAARGSEGRLFPWGDLAPTVARVNACDADCVALLRRLGLPTPSASFAGNDTHGSTGPVGSFAGGNASSGLADLAGNVGEWTGDWFAPYGAAPASNPTGPAGGDQRVVRGGHWYSGNPAALRSSARTPAPPSLRLATVGFRCMHAPIIELPPPPVAPPPVEEAPAERPTRRRHGGR